MKRKMAFALDFIQLPRLLMILRKRYALVSELTKSLTGSDGGRSDRRSAATAAEKLGKYFPTCRETRKIFSELKKEIGLFFF